MTQQREYSLFLVPGGAIEWTDDLLEELRRCIVQEVPASATAKRLGMATHSVARGAMILCRRMMLDRQL